MNSKMRALWPYGFGSDREVADETGTIKSKRNDTDAVDKTALAVTLVIALIAGLLVLLRLYFGGQMSHWFG